MTVQDKLTPEQIANWRKALCMSLGPYALVMPDEDIQKLRDNMQEYAITIPIPKDEAMTSQESLSHLRQINLYNIDDVRVIEKHIAELEMKIESQNIEIKRLNTYLWNNACGGTK